MLIYLLGLPQLVPICFNKRMRDDNVTMKLDCQKRLKRDNRNKGKGNATVIMDSAEYHHKMSSILSDSNTYQKVDRNPLRKVRQQVMSSINGASSISDEGTA